MDALTAIPPHWGPVRIFLGGPPLWVVVVTVILAMRGWRARHPARVSLLQLAAFPVLLLAWQAWTLGNAGAISVVTPAVWLLGLLLGGWGGRLLARVTPVVRDGGHGVVIRAGDGAALPLMLGVFLFEFVVVRTQVHEPALAADPVFLSGYAAVAGVFAGLWLGRLEGWLRQYRHAAPAIPGQ